MGQLIASAIAFAIGMLLLPTMVRGVRVRGMSGALKAGIVTGILSAVLGKVLLIVLSLILFLPIVLTGPFGVFAVQALVNAILLTLTSKLVSGIEFDRSRTVLWAACALTALQTVAKLLL
jgi:uncharacterized membrane protein YvlD (DUF360 family)